MRRTKLLAFILLISSQAFSIEKHRIEPAYLPEHVFTIAGYGTKYDQVPDFQIASNNEMETKPIMKSNDFVENMINKFIFFPRKNNSQYSNLWKSSELILKINQQELQGWFVKAIPVNQAPLIIYYGGNAEDISNNLRHLHQAQAPSISWLFMNYRGFGNSSGNPSQSGLFEDALAIYDYLTHNLHIPPDKIFLMGRSIGSSIASYVASQRQVAGLILVTPFDSISSFVPKILKFPPITTYFEDYFNTQKYLENVQGKILVLSAGEDEVIPKGSLENLVNKFKDQLITVEIKRANHQNIAEFPEYEKAITKYINSQPILEKN